MLTLKPLSLVARNAATAVLLVVLLPFTLFSKPLRKAWVTDAVRFASAGARTVRFLVTLS